VATPKTRKTILKYVLMREGMSYEEASEYAELNDETLVADIIYMLRQMKGLKPSDIAKMTFEEIRYYSLLAQEDIRRAETSKNEDLKTRRGDEFLE